MSSRPEAEAASYINFWTLFGASNQLLAALTLLSITVWLSNARQRFGFTLFPMAFVLVMTLWSLGKLTLVNFRAAKGWTSNSSTALLRAP